MRLWIAAVAVAAVVSGCASDSSSQDPAVAKYTQTWPKGYGATTCAEWLDSMAPEQRFAASADMLAGARNKGDGGEGLPSDSLINEFKEDVDAACGAVPPPSSLAEAGAAVYLAGRSHYRP